MVCNNVYIAAIGCNQYPYRLLGKQAYTYSRAAIHQLAARERPAEMPSSNLGPRHPSQMVQGVATVA